MTVRRTKPINMMLTIALLIGVWLLIGGCNTVEGVGHDLSAAGEGLADVASDMNPSKSRTNAEW